VLLPIGARENALLESKLGLNYCSAAYVDWRICLRQTA